MNGPSEVGNDPTFEPARTSPIYDTPVTEPHEIARAAAILEEREKIPLSDTQCEQIEEAVEAPRTEGHTTFQPMAVKVNTTGKKLADLSDADLQHLIGRTYRNQQLTSDGETLEAMQAVIDGCRKELDRRRRRG